MAPNGGNVPVGVNPSLRSIELVAAVSQPVLFTAMLTNMIPVKFGTLPESREFGASSEL